MHITGLLFAAALAIAGNASYQSVETDLIGEINAIRTDPQGYARALEDYRKYYTGKEIRRPGEVTILTQEGVAAVDEAIAVLKVQKPLPPLAPNKKLAALARDHVADTGPLGLVGHNGSDGSTFSARAGKHGITTGAGENIAYGYATARLVAFQLVIDDGVPGRGHRKNILTKDYVSLGTACGVHARYGHMCVVDFGMKAPA